MAPRFSHRIYRLTEGARQLFAVATMGAIVLAQPLRPSTPTQDQIRIKPAVVRTVGFSSREFASGHGGAGGKTSGRGGQT